MSIERELKHHVEVNVTDFGLKKICKEILEDDAFYKETGANRYHHAYEGGLASHTLETLDMAIAMGVTQCANLEILTVAIVFHDVGKIADHASKSHASKIGHLCRSLMEFHHRARSCSIDINKRLMMEIEHCIITHHGRQEWGSPMTAKTPEADIIHFADMMSSQHGQSKHGLYKELRDEKSTETNR